MSKMHGKTVLITGGGRGIGRALVEAFDVAGAEVMSCGRSPRPADLPANVHWQQMDVASSEQVDRLRQQVIQHFGTLSVLINNAGIQIEKTVVETTDADWDQLMGVNAKGVFLTCRAMIPLMPKTSTAAIINIGSISGQVADLNMALYNASKAFVHGLTRSLAVDHGPLRCNAICPGWIMTEMAQAGFALAENPQAAQADALVRHPIRRFGCPDDVAKLALWLASDDAAFVTGQCFTLDGGLTAASPLNPRLF